MRLGVDVGGTFTDLLLHDEKTQRTFQAKTPSTPEDQSIGVAAGVKLICEKAGIEIVLFRGAERNKRRGFHNLHVFRQRLDRELKGSAA